MKLNSRFLATVTGVLALAAGAAQAANIGTVAAAKTTYSKEGVADVASVTLPIAVITLDAAYAAGDQAKVTLGGPTLDPASAPTLVCNGAPNAVFGSLGITGQVISFRVTSVAVADTTGTACQLSGVKTTGASIATASAVTIGYAATAGSTTTAIDTGCVGGGCVANSGTIATVRNQFAASLTTGFSGIIDVSSPSLRTLFTTTPAADVATLSISTDPVVDLPAGTYDAVNFTSPAVPTGIAVTLNGDFSFTDADKSGTCTTAEVTAVLVPVPGNLVIASGSCTAVKFTYANNHNPDVVPTVSIDPTKVAVANRVALKAQTFKFNVVTTYTGAGATTGLTSTSNFDGGSWSLNGASVFVPYMPYGTGISQILYVTNNSSLDGEITVDWIDDAVPAQAGSFSAGTSKAGSVSSISAAVAAGLATGGFSGTGKVALTITVNSPSANVEVFSAYNAAGNRNVVVNTSNGVGGGH